MEQNKQPESQPVQNSPQETMTIQGATVHLRYASCEEEPPCLTSIQQLLISSLSS